MQLPSRQHSWTIDEEHSREIIKRGLDLGVNFYDTAIAYQSGTSEQYVGRALREFAKREDVVGATKLHHIEGAAKAVDLELTDEELDYLEEPYVPHPLAGVMAQNKRTDASKKHVWTIGAQKIVGGEK
nr:aldo/keto reductase [Butyrivibrio sp. WCD3002]